MNSVNLVGRITADPIVKGLGEKDGKEILVTNFTLAVNRPFTDAPADFISCVAWNKDAAFIGKYVVKGNRLAISGRIETRSYEIDGDVKYVTEVRVESVQSLETKPVEEVKKEEPKKETPKSKTKTYSKDNLPF